MDSKKKSKRSSSKDKKAKQTLPKLSKGNKSSKNTEIISNPLTTRSKKTNQSMLETSNSNFIPNTSTLSIRSRRGSAKNISTIDVKEDKSKNKNAKESKKNKNASVTKNGKTTMSKSKSKPKSKAKGSKAKVKQSNKMIETSSSESEEESESSSEGDNDKKNPTGNGKKKQGKTKKKSNIDKISLAETPESKPRGRTAKKVNEEKNITTKTKSKGKQKNTKKEDTAKLSKENPIKGKQKRQIEPDLEEDNDLGASDNEETNMPNNQNNKQSKGKKLTLAEQYPGIEIISNAIEVVKIPKFCNISLLASILGLNIYHLVKEFKSINYSYAGITDFISDSDLKNFLKIKYPKNKFKLIPQLSNKFPGLYSESLASLATKQIMISGDYQSANLKFLKDMGITHILVVGAFLKVHFPEEFKYKILDLYDHPEINAFQFFEEAFTFIDEVVSSNGRVLVHCGSGMSLSPTIVCSYLIKKNNITYEEALEIVKNARSSVEPNEGFEEQLKLWYQQEVEHKDVSELLSLCKCNCQSVSNQVEKMEIEGEDEKAPKESKAAGMDIES